MSYDSGQLVLYTVWVSCLGLRSRELSCGKLTLIQVVRILTSLQMRGVEFKNEFSYL